MPIWNSERVKSTLSLVNDFDVSRVKNGAYELALGDAAITDETGKPKRLSLSENESFEILPGQFALLITQEKILIPNNVQGRISIKSKVKFHGLVNVSGFHVDPGFEGRLKFAVHNAGGQSIILQHGQILFQIWFEEMCGEEEPYGYKREHDFITAADLDRLKGHPASPAATLAKVEEIARDASIKRAALTTLATSALIATLVFTLTTAIRIPSKDLGDLVAAATRLISSEKALAAKPLIDEQKQAPNSGVGSSGQEGMSH